MDFQAVIRAKTAEFTNTFQTFFLYKIADRIGTNIIGDNHGNELAILALLASSILVTVCVAHFTEGVLDDAVSRNNKKETTLVGWIEAPVRLFLELLGAIAQWQTQLFSVVCGNYITMYSDEDALDAVPITLAVGSFLFLAKQAIFSEN